MNCCFINENFAETISLENLKKIAKESVMNIEIPESDTELIYTKLTGTRNFTDFTKIKEKKNNKQTNIGQKEIDFTKIKEKKKNKQTNIGQEETTNNDKESDNYEKESLFEDWKNGEENNDVLMDYSGDFHFEDFEDEQ